MRYIIKYTLMNSGRHFDGAVEDKNEIDNCTWLKIILPKMNYLAIFIDGFWDILLKKAMFKRRK